MYVSPTKDNFSAEFNKNNITLLPENPIISYTHSFYYTHITYQAQIYDFRDSSAVKRPTLEKHPQNIDDSKNYLSNSPMRIVKHVTEKQ